MRLRLKKEIKLAWVKAASRASFALLLLLWLRPAEAVTIQQIASNISATVTSLAKMLQAIALIAGIGFVLAAFFKFHQHKQNPTQVPISQGLTLLLIGAGLTLFPVLIPTAGSVITGSTNDIASVSGSEIRAIITN